MRTARPIMTTPSAIVIGHAEERARVYPESQLAQLNGRVRWLSEPLEAKEFLARADELSGVEVIFGTWGMPWLDRELLARLPDLRAIFYAAGTLRTFVPDEFWERDIVITTAAKYNAIPVADVTLAALIFGLKGLLPAARESARLRRLYQKASSLTPGTYRSRIGLLSYGAIARLVRARLKLLEVEVLVHDPYLTSEEARREEIELVDLDALFARCDAVSVHTPLLPSTQGLVRGEHIRSLPPHAVFINTARGGVIEQEEMIAALRARPDIEAFIDVADPEPPDVSCPLFDLPNVLFTPHVAGSTGREVARLGQAMIDEFDRYSIGQPLLHQVLHEHAEFLA